MFITYNSNDNTSNTLATFKNEFGDYYVVGISRLPWIKNLIILNTLDLGLPVTLYVQSLKIGKKTKHHTVRLSEQFQAILPHPYYHHNRPEYHHFGSYYLGNVCYCKMIVNKVRDNKSYIS